jgi:hypothetical protein
MKNRNPIFIAIVFALAFALTPVTQAGQNPGGIPTIQPANEQASPEGENRPVITIHSAGNILRGKTGSFVLEMKPALAFGGMYVNFKVSGTAVAGVDYVALVTPAYIGQSGFATIMVRTLPNPRGSLNRQAYSLVLTLEPGAGYAVGRPSSAKLLISTSCALEACW